MKQVFALKQLLTLVLTGSLSISILQAETWVDEDGGQIVDIRPKEIAIYDASSFFYFDQMFIALKDQRALRFCFGYSRLNGMATDCLEGLNMSIKVANRGNVRGILIDMKAYPFVVDSLNSSLLAGNHLTLSVDDHILFTAVNLHKDYGLNEDFFD